MTLGERRDEESLVRAAQAGDADAFVELLHGCDREILSVLVRFAGDRCDREDLYQEVFLEAFRSLHRFRFRSSFRTWLYRLAFHRCLGHVRRRRTHEELPERAVGPHDVERAARLRAVRRALDRLPEKQRLCFFLHYVEGWTVAEVAERVGIRSGTVKTHLHRAREAVRSTEEVRRWQPIPT